MGAIGQETVSRRILITKPELNGKMLSQLKIRNNFGASITRVNRSGVDLVAAPQLQLQMGDPVLLLLVASWRSVMRKKYWEIQ